MKDGCLRRALRYVEVMVDARAELKDYTVPEGCPVCAADLPIRVTEKGPNAVCRQCGYVGRPRLTLTWRGLVLQHEGAQA